MTPSQIIDLKTTFDGIRLNNKRLLDELALANETSLSPTLRDLLKSIATETNKRCQKGMSLCKTPK